jgi:DNA mismatch repair protein MutS2
VPAATPARTFSVDLHGLTTVEALDALDAFLNDALLAAATEARVIHGRSGGVVRAAVHARLSQLTSVRSFRIDPRNAGVTIVTF